MKTIGVPIRWLPITDKIPDSVPVNYEFDFCEQIPEAIVLTLRQQDVNDLSTDLFTKAKAALKRK